MKKTIAILIGKIIIVLGKILNRGSSLPGKIALQIDPLLFSKLSYPKNCIAITGSSGKGSTSKLIANTLKECGYKVCFNSAGSNLDRGILSSILKYTNLFGKVKSDYLVMEVDERYTKRIFKYIKPKYVVVTNLTKDQPPRQFDVDIVYQDILNSIDASSTIITNMDDPYLRNFAKDLNKESIYYSLAQNKYSYKKQIFENLNIYECPYCGTHLDYEYYNFETLGKYICPNCNFKYEEPKYLASSLNLDAETIIINNEELKIGGDMLYNAYNTLAAYTTLKELNISEPKIIEAINRENKVAKKKFSNFDRDFYPISCKAENCTTFNQAVFKAFHDKTKKDIVIGWKEISRRYKHYDVSWLYDVEFELLNNKTLNRIYVCGIDKENLKKRLILAGINESLIQTADNIEEIKNDIINDPVESIYGILNFDYVSLFEEAFKEETK